MTRPALRALLFGLAVLYPTGAYMGAQAEPVVRWVRPGAEMPAQTVATAPAALEAPLKAASKVGPTAGPETGSKAGRIAPAAIEATIDTTIAATIEATTGLSGAIRAASARPYAPRAVPPRMANARAEASHGPLIEAAFLPGDEAATRADVIHVTAPATPAARTPSYDRPWKDENEILVLDGYEFNELDWQELAKDERIRGFISKASDGMPEVYDCRNGGLQNSSPRHCKTRWRKYSVTKELYKTRRAMAKALGWKWGAYHMGRPGNPEAQADHFIDFADPQPDEFIAIDLEDNDPEKWMSLEETERFARRVHQRIGRWPALYTNGSTAKTIAQRKDEFPILSRLPLWYARFRPEIEGVFPMGHWDSYHTWQFLAQINCKRSCAMRPKGTNRDIDVNVVNATEETLDAMWATKDLLPLRGEQSVPTLMVDAEPTETAQPSYATAYADDEGTSTRVKAVFDEVLKVEDSVKAKLALDTPVPTMRPL